MAEFSCNIIIPFYKQRAYLERLIANLQECYLPYVSVFSLEVIIVNDSPEIAIQSFEFLNENQLNFSLQLIQHTENLGVAIARETALKQAKADWIMLLDQDDALQTKVFDVLVDAHKRQINFALMNGFLIHASPKLKFPIYFFEPSLTLKNLIVDDFIRSPGQVFFRRELTEKLSYPKPHAYKGCDDRFLWIQLFLLNPNLRTKYYAAKHYLGHIHGENAGLDSSKLYKCSQDLWEHLSAFDFGSNQIFVEKNKQVLRFILQQESSLAARISYVQYKYRLNRFLRYLVKLLVRYIKLYK